MMKPARSAAITLKSCWTEHARRRGGVRSDTAAERVDCALSPCRGFFGAFCEFLCEQAEFAAAPGAAAPDETNLSCRIMAEQRPGNEVCALKQAGINSESRQQGGAETVVDHLHQCRKARRLRSEERRVGKECRGRGAGE